MLFAGGLQVTFCAVALLFGIKLALTPGLTASGWLAGVFIPVVELLFVLLALKIGWQMVRKPVTRGTSVRLRNALLVQLVVFGLFAALFWLKSLHDDWPGQWFVTDYKQLPSNPVYGKSAPITVGIFTPLVFCSFLSALLLLPSAMLASNTPKEEEVASEADKA